MSIQQHYYKTKHLLQVTHFAMEHGEGCRASVRCLAARKPPGFKKATEDLYFNLEDRTAA